MSTEITALNTPSSVEVSFSWTPADTFNYVSPGGNHVTGPSAEPALLLTFTATTALNDSTNTLSVVEYRWDFGDGSIAYGISPTHIYDTGSMFTRTILTVTDSLGRQWFATAPMYINPPAPVDPQSLPQVPILAALTLGA